MKKVKWKQINWEQAETYINRLQIRIVKAVKENKWRTVPDYTLFLWKGSGSQTGNLK